MSEEEDDDDLPFQHYMKVNDIVLFNLQECKVLEVNGERAILYAPLKAEPYLVVFVKDCTPLYKKEGKLNS